MASVLDRVKLLQPESLRLKQYLHALPREAWHQPSACTQWQVQDVVAHLVGAAEAYMAWISRGVQGEASPPAGLPPAETLNAGLAAEMIAQRSISKRETLGEHVLAAFEATDDALHRLLAALGPRDWE